MNRFCLSIVIPFMFFCSASVAGAQDVTLRVHHFMSEKSSLHSQMLVPLAERISEASDGRIKLELYAAMSLGGRAVDLYDQAIDGAVDVILTLPGYTAGRFPEAEVFELPFMMEDSIATSKAYWDLVERRLQDTTFQDTKILLAWVHGRGVLHSQDPINSMEDLRGMEIRGPSRLVTDLLGELGATPVGMALPSIPENMSKGVISGAALPWEIVPSIKLHEMVENHTELSGSRAFYTAVFVLAMNWEAYEAMPADLRAILDAETGKAASAFAAGVVARNDAAAREMIAKTNNVIVLDEEEVARWIEAAQPVYDRWVQMANDVGFDGAAAIEEAKELIAANQ